MPSATAAPSDSASAMATGCPMVGKADADAACAVSGTVDCVSVVMACL